MKLPVVILVLSFFLNATFASALTFTTDGALLIPHCLNNSNDIAIYLSTGDTLLDGFGCENERNAGDLGGDFVFYESPGLCTMGLTQSQCADVDVGYAYAVSDTFAWFLPFTVISGGVNDALIASIGAFVSTSWASIMPIVAFAIALGLTLWVIYEVMDFFNEKRYGKNKKSN